jgi:hypothetical protein
LLAFSSSSSSSCSVFRAVFEGEHEDDDEDDRRVPLCKRGGEGDFSPVLLLPDAAAFAVWR